MARIVEVFGIETGEVYFRGPKEVVFQLLQKQYPSCKGMKPIYPVYPETLRIVEVKERKRKDGTARKKHQISL